MANRIHRSELESDQSGGPFPGTAPGKRSLTSSLAGRSQIVFRVESAEAAHALFGPRDPNGVAAGADVAVDRAAGSSGSPLPEHLRGRFESSLGTDLSSVRIHTGSESAEASSAVGAKAYTTGQDIHFGAGQYDPSSAFGVHLIAHEVAHTVQQQGASPTRQNKLEVSTPQDGAELEADRAADAMVAGTAASVANVGHGAARKILRESDAPSSPDLDSMKYPPSNVAIPSPISHPQWDRQEQNKYNGNFKGVSPATEDNWMGYVAPHVGPVQGADLADPEFELDAADRCGAWQYVGATTGGCELEKSPDGVDPPQYWQDLNACSNAEYEALSGRGEPIVGELVGIWSRVQQMLPIAKTASTDYETAAASPELHGLTGAGSPATDKNSSGAQDATPIGALQQGTAPTQGSVADAVSGGRPMGMPKGPTIESTFTSPDAANAAAQAKGHATDDLVKSVAAYKKSEVDLQKVADTQMAVAGSLPSKISDYNAALDEVRVAEEEEFQKATAAEMTAAEGRKKIWMDGLTAAKNVIGAAGERKPEKIIGVGIDLVGYFISGECDKNIRSLKAASDQSTSLVASLKSDKAKAAAAKAAKVVKDFAGDLATAKRAVMTAEDDRRTKLNAMSTDAAANAAAGGAELHEQQALQTQIRALPAIEIVCASLEGVIGTLALPGYTQRSGVAASVCINIMDLVDSYGDLRGARQFYEKELTLWRDRKKTVLSTINSVI